MSLHAITVLGHDRPGIIAETTGKLAGLGLNLEDSTMTLLRGHFAMMLVCAGSASDVEIESALAPLTGDGTLTVTVREVPEERARGTAGTSWVLTVHGGDRPGIVSSIVGEVAKVGGNITDLTTRLSGDLYLLIAEIDLLSSSVRVVVALGGYGWGAALTAYRDAGYAVPRPRPKFAHAAEVDLGGVTLLGCYHPSQHNTFTGRLTPEMLDDVFLRARALADSRA